MSNAQAPAPNPSSTMLLRFRVSNVRSLRGEQDLTLVRPDAEAVGTMPVAWAQHGYGVSPLAGLFGGAPHPDYAPVEKQVTADKVTELEEWCQPSELLYQARADEQAEVCGLAVIVDGVRVPARFGDWIIQDGFGNFTVRGGDRPS